LNKWGQYEATRNDRRVISLNWGPWEGGMVTAPLKALFENEGVGLIPLREGARFLVDEIRASSVNHDVELVVLGGGSDLERLAPKLDVAPSKEGQGVSRPASLTSVFERTLDPDEMPVLRSHVIDGRAVLPVALILEMLAQGALQRNPGLSFQGVDDLKILKGVVHHQDRAETLAVFVGKAARDGASYALPVELRGTTAGGKTVTHARATVLLGDRPLAGDRPRIEVPGLPAYPRSTRAVYHDVLFHGPDLHGLERIEACASEGILATAKTAPAPSAWLERPLRQAWLSDPLAVDCAFQLMVLWSSEQTGAPSLPTAVGRYRQFRRAFPSPRVQIAVRVTRSDALHAVADIEFLDGDGSLVARIEGYECASNPSLNQAFRRNRLPKAARSSL
jgi:hypothetical protein